MNEKKGKIMERKKGKEECEKGMGRWRERRKESKNTRP